MDTTFIRKGSGLAKRQWFLSFENYKWDEKVVGENDSPLSEKTKGPNDKPSRARQMARYYERG